MKKPLASANVDARGFLMALVEEKEDQQLRDRKPAHQNDQKMPESEMDVADDDESYCSVVIHPWQKRQKTEKNDDETLGNKRVAKQMWPKHVFGKPTDQLKCSLSRRSRYSASLSTS